MRSPGALPCPVTGNAHIVDAEPCRALDGSPLRALEEPVWDNFCTACGESWHSHRAKDGGRLES